tara:strand:- start:62 stop:823 length:762 start_codon:yes stop_codon:yes gene_type:complete
VIKDEVLTLIKEGKIKELNQIDKEFILEKDILDFFLLTYLSKEEINDSLSLITSTRNKFSNESDFQKVIDNEVKEGNACHDFKALIFEDMMDNNGLIKTLDEYRSLIKEFRRKKLVTVIDQKVVEVSEDYKKKEPNGLFVNTTDEKKLKEKEYRYEAYKYLLDKNFDDAKRDILFKYKNHFSVPKGEVLEWIPFERVHFKDLDIKLRHDESICKYAIMDEVENYHFFPNELKKNDAFINDLLKDFPELQKELD